MTIDHIIEESKGELLPYEMRHLTDELRAKAKCELFETEETKISSIKLLKSMIKEETELETPTDDVFLLKFLRARKFDVKKTFSLLKNFYHVRGKHYELYDDFQFSRVQKTMDGNFLGFLPYRDPEGSVILLMQTGKWNPSEVTLGDVMATLTSGLVQAIMSPATQIAGFKVIVDFKGFGMRHFTSLSTSYLWLFAEALQNCFPGRFRAVHIVNETTMWTYIWAVLKQVLSKKLRERFQFHGKNVKKLQKYFPASILPEEYGGELGPFDNTHWMQRMQQNEKFISETFKYGYKTKN